MKPREIDGDRQQLADEIEDSVQGWRCLGNDELSQQAKAAVNELRNGADRVQVGHTIYNVKD
ncbi:hypothetical protein [Streptomyces lycii]|uniref:Uncharacterized protein n=1 Tax=Streptomyces lycii TaxID=2654337 RepID=A0ABQ7FLG3_9ACTN|nr:hypothetical protein [Streptomyces lycii]KAF4408606.1 hypothetical protein GCU69_12975 [Streptomyces lycii]